MRNYRLAKSKRRLLATGIVFLLSLSVTSCADFEILNSNNMNSKSDRKTERFADVYQRCIQIVDKRLAEYKPSDPLSRDNLEFFRNVLISERQRVLAEPVTPYDGGLWGPIKALMDLGEPPESELSDAVYEIELFYRENY